MVETRPFPKMVKGLTKKQFDAWKKHWYYKVPHCALFVCVHELMSCGINVFCGYCSIYETYTRDPHPVYCDTVSCIDCARRGECKVEVTLWEGKYETEKN